MRRWMCHLPRPHHSAFTVPSAMANRPRTRVPAMHGFRVCSRGQFTGCTCFIFQSSISGFSSAVPGVGVRGNAVIVVLSQRQSSEVVFIIKRFSFCWTPHFCAVFCLMRPFAKFAVFLALAGILAILFAFLPGNRDRAPAKTAPVAPPSSSSSGGQLLPHVLRESPALSRETRAAIPVPNLSPATQERMPAIRRGTDYGWVQLPQGTQVDLIRRTSGEFWIRWDGATASVSETAVISGAIILRKGAMPETPS